MLRVFTVACVAGLIAAAACCRPAASAPESGKAEPGKAGPFRLVFKFEEDDYRKLLPATDDEWLKELLAKDLIWYGDRDMPTAYQVDGGAHDPGFKITGQALEPFGNANREFPWGRAGGTHRCPNASALRFVHLPGPILWWRDALPRPGRLDREPVTRWHYPDRTTFAEVLLVADGQGDRHAFELRTRTKVQGRWRPNVFRPFATRAELADWLRENAPGVRLPPADPTVGRLRSPHPDRTAVDLTAAVDELPEFPAAVVDRMLARPFRSTMGEEWVRKGDVPGYAPTTKAAYGPVPKDYDGAFLEMSTKACMTCHADVLEHADSFDFRRDWYGRVRGDDAIFSFHVFEPADISRNGVSTRPRVRQALVDAGLLRQRQ